MQGPESTGEQSGKFSRAPAADLWRNTLSQIPTTFGRLAYLSSLRNQNTGAYEHHGLARIFGDEEAARTLAESHRRIFSQWLCFGLERQMDDLTEYLEGLEEDVRLVLENWLRFPPYRNFIPAGTRETERELYLTDLEMVVGRISRERGAAAPGPES